MHRCAEKARQENKETRVQDLSSTDEVPPWLREQLARFEQLQQNLQTILVQKQQVDLEAAEVDRALAELKKVSDADPVYKSAGNILVKADKASLERDLEERKDLAATRSTVLGKQEQRVRENIKELQTKIEDAVRGRGGPQQAAMQQQQPQGA
jgi:prefoldin beta subunit